MRKLMLPAAAIAFVALDATPAKAQVVIGSGYSSPGYYGGYAPYDRSSGIVMGNGGIGMYPAYSGFGDPSYTPYHGGSYNPYHGGGFNPYYGMGYRSNYGGWYGGYSGGYSGGWRR